VTAPDPVARPDVAALDAASRDAVVAALAPLFEGAPRFLARLVAARPFGDWVSLFATGRAIAHAMPEDEQVELIDAHPRLGAPPATVSALSFHEQGYDREAADRGDAETASAAAAEAERRGVAAELDRLNAAYEARFGFRYCVVVAGRPRAALLPDMAAALTAGRDAELQRALDAVVDVAMARLSALRTAGG
jgi:2-oxo-4-hydroxy-4-carboxy-5-ureidoimidazoline decarboxylase